MSDGSGNGPSTVAAGAVNSKRTPSRRPERYPRLFFVAPVTVESRHFFDPHRTFREGDHLYAQGGGLCGPAPRRHVKAAVLLPCAERDGDRPVLGVT